MASIQAVLSTSLAIDVLVYRSCSITFVYGHLGWACHPGHAPLLLSVQCAFTS